MNKEITTKEKQLQGLECEEHGELLREHLRGAVRAALGELMAEEVQALCGDRYQRGRAREFRRGGHDDGVMYFGGRKESIDRPRVRRKRGDGKEEEVPLKTYKQGRSTRNIEGEIFAMMSEGVSARGCQRLSGKTISPGLASRLWVERSAGKLEELRSRELSKDIYFGLIVDGVFLSRELVVIVAMGITRDGTKQMLDFSVGSTESYEVAKELLGRLKERGFRVEGRLLAILDGSPALRKALMEQWPSAVVQHCLIHKERNIHRHLRRSDHGEFSRLMARLRAAQGGKAGGEALEALRRFLTTRNQAALASLNEAGDDLIALHLLEAPATLNSSLLSTNLIENAIHNYRRQTNRVTRWRPETKQVDRWTATALLWVEAGFRKIRGHADLPKLMDALKVFPGDVASVPNSPPPNCPAPSLQPPASDELFGPFSAGGRRQSSPQGCSAHHANISWGTTIASQTLTQPL